MCVSLARDGAGEEEVLLATAMGHHGEPEEIAAGAPTAKVQGAVDPPPTANSFSRGPVPASPNLFPQNTRLYLVMIWETSSSRAVVKAVDLVSCGCLLNTGHGKGADESCTRRPDLEWRTWFAMKELNDVVQQLEQEADVQQADLCKKSSTWRCSGSCGSTVRSFLETSRAVVSKGCDFLFCGMSTLNRPSILVYGGTIKVV